MTPVSQSVRDLPDNALRLYVAFFLPFGSTLRFGGEGAAAKITEEGRRAMNALLRSGAIREIEPDCDTPGREHYGKAFHSEDIREEIAKRASAAGDSFFGWSAPTDFRLFEDAHPGSGLAVVTSDGDHANAN